MKAKFCIRCRRYVEVRYDPLMRRDKCPTCKQRLKAKHEVLPDAFGAMPDFVDGPRTEDDDFLDELLYK